MPKHSQATRVLSDVMCYSYVTGLNKPAHTHARWNFNKRGKIRNISMIHLFSTKSLLRSSTVPRMMWGIFCEQSKGGFSSVQDWRSIFPNRTPSYMPLALKKDGAGRIPRSRTKRPEDATGNRYLSRCFLGEVSSLPWLMSGFQ